MRRIFRSCDLLCGGFAGVVLGQSIPQASAEIDDVHLDILAGSFRRSLHDAREKERAVN